jgi:hypothetical protein
LKRQGYNDKDIESVFSKGSEINRNDLLEYKEKRSINGFPMFSLTIPLYRKVQALFVIIEKKLTKVKR